MRTYKLIHILKGGTSGEISLLEFIPFEEVLSWLEGNEKAKYVLAEMIPLKIAEPKLHPLVRELLSRYGTDNKIKSALSSNWYEEGWSGPASEHYKSKLTIALDWAKDVEPNTANWAKEEVAHLRKLIEATEKKEQEEDF